MMPRMLHVNAIVEMDLMAKQLSNVYTVDAFLYQEYKLAIKICCCYELL